ncbi:HAUS augmin-like complex subunit 3 [Armadillidium nasatum]|uniref:HAUS augmin-like complex subunit 3 n=1 Tax=Armadillidium nasatum TaxID=96803 RepID=A0A5N5SRZ4_9CRUS|nr:HAUS augmin-like complex subunit 3 [Armadillidium nasatum]
MQDAQMDCIYTENLKFHLYFLISTHANVISSYIPPAKITRHHQGYFIYMDGNIFISNLKILNIPGVENLKPNDIDWVFLNSESSFPYYWNWFFSNVKEDDILSDEELEQYEKLLSSGSVLSKKHLKQIENCMENVSTEEDLPLISFMLDEGSREDLVMYENKLKWLNKKRDLLRRHCVDRLRHELESQTLRALHVCNDYSKGLEDISKHIQTNVIPFQSFKSNAEEAKFVTQIPKDIWLEQERTFIEVLFKYIHKQFHEGIESFVDLDDDSQHCLMDSSQLDLQFIRGPKQSDYLRNVQDLNRINVSLEETELKTIECEVGTSLQNCRNERSGKISENALLSDFVLFISFTYQLASLKETYKALDQDLQFQKESLKELGSLVSKIEGFRVISGNYEMKLKRQEYLLSKQETVKEFLLGHLSRLDLMKIMYDVDKQKIDTILDILINVNKSLINQYEGTITRLDLLNQLKELYVQNGLVNEEEKTLQALLCYEDEATDPQVIFIMK